MLSIIGLIISVAFTAVIWFGMKALTKAIEANTAAVMESARAYDRMAAELREDNEQ